MVFCAVRFSTAGKPETKAKHHMTLESVTSTLEERGIVWQGVGFATVGAISVPLLWVYSETDHWGIGFYRLAVTQLSWAFVVVIALVIERTRMMFETKTEIRRVAREKAIEEARVKGREEGMAEGERLAAERMRSKLRAEGIQLSPEAEARIFNGDNGR